MGPWRITKILVEGEADKEALTRRILAELPGTETCFLKDPYGLLPDRSNMGKDTLHLLSYKGEFLKPCPGTSGYICCGYQILNLATNCPLDCTYCILQYYFNQPNLRVFANLEQGLQSALKTIDGHPERVFRVGTGEFTDSLALNPLTHWTDILIPEFSKRKNTALELKTKTVNIHRLFDSRFRERIIISWSLNSPRVAVRDEHGAASLRKRISAAAQCQSEGFLVGFHFDPLIAHAEWKDQYRRTVDLLSAVIDPKKIIWISLGSLRFMPGLKDVIRKRHPENTLFGSELIFGLDGKMRYFKPIRIELYAFMKEILSSWYPDLGLYLCMESDQVWEQGLGWSPGTSSELSGFLDRRVRNFFG